MYIYSIAKEEYDDNDCKARESIFVHVCLCIDMYVSSPSSCTMRKISRGLGLTRYHLHLRQVHPISICVRLYLYMG